MDIVDKIAEKIQCTDCEETGAVTTVPPKKLPPADEFKSSVFFCCICSVPGASVTSVDGKQQDSNGKKICLIHDSLMNGGVYDGYCNTSIRLGMSGLVKTNYYKYVYFLLKEMDAYYAEMRPKVLHSLKDVYSRLRAGEGAEQRQRW